MAYELQLQIPTDEAVAYAVQALNNAGFRVEQSFALRESWHYIVLLVYGEDTTPPSTILVHGCDTCSRFMLPDSVGSNTKHHTDIYKALASIAMSRE